MPYIGRGSDFGVRSVFHFLASNGDTSVSGADADGKNLNFPDGNFIDVYLNGVRLKSGEDYNTATANTVAGLSALNANDEVNIVVYDTFTVADTVKASEGGTFAGAVAVTATTASSSATTGALTVSGGAGIAADLSVGDDLRLISDSAVLSFGADSDTTLTHTDGSGLTLNSTNKLMFGDTGTFIHQSADGVLDLVSDTELELNATTIDVNGKIDLAGGSLEGGVVINEDSADVDFRVESNGNTHALFVDAGNGHVNINTDTDLGSDLNINGEVTIANANSGIIMVENAADAFGSNFTMRKSRNTTLNGHTVVQEDDVTGNINFQGSDGTDFHSTASIQSAVDDTPGNNDMPGRLMFSTTANSGSSPAERMRIDESGRVLIGTTQTLFDNAQTLQVSGSQACNMRSTVSTADGGHVIGCQRSGNTQGDYIRFFDSSGNETGQIRVDSGGTCQFEDVSDYRLKDNIKDWDVDASAKVKQVKIRTFDWKDQTTQTNGKDLVGVIAHELQEVYPHCVSGQKDGYGGDVDKDGNKKPMYQGVDYGKLTPLLTKALQEALARIDTLETKVKTLEGG